MPSQIVLEGHVEKKVGCGKEGYPLLFRLDHALMVRIYASIADSKSIRSLLEGSALIILGPTSSKRLSARHAADPTFLYRQCLRYQWWLKFAHVHRN